MENSIPEGNGEQYEAVALFAPDGNKLTGTFLTELEITAFLKEMSAARFS